MNAFETLKEKEKKKKLMNSNKKNKCKKKLNFANHWIWAIAT